MTKLITTADYVLLYSEDLNERKQGTICVCLDEVKCNALPENKGHNVPEIIDWQITNNCGGCRKIIAHLPLNQSSVLEGVLLLPELKQVDEYRKAANIFKETCEDFAEADEINECDEREQCFVEGYKAASQKKYSEEDIRKAIGMTREKSDKWRTSGLTPEYKFSENEIIQSLSPKPTGFEPEYEIFTWTESGRGEEPRNMREEKLKTTKTTFRDKEVEQLEGRWIYVN